MAIPVPAILHRARHGYSWRVTCPYCGKIHHHGGGPLDQDPRALLGHRLAHCGAADGYVLVASGSIPPQPPYPTTLITR